MPELDSLRGLAILGVLFLHGFYWQYPDWHFGGVSGLFVRATGWGWLGVNLFFVLSGFLITGILLESSNEPHYYRRFYLRRALRILPAYYGLLLLLGIFREASAPYLGVSFVYLANLTALLGVSNDYGPLWSLAVEEHYYIFWPLIVRRLNVKKLAIVAFLVCLIVPLLRIAAFALGTVEGLSSYTWLVADGLATGALIACLLRSSLTRWRAAQLCGTLLALAPTLALVGAPFGIMTRRRLLGASLQYTVINIMFAGVLLLFLLLGTSKWKSLVDNSVLKFFGYISYGLYLIHLLVFRLFDEVCRRLWPSLRPIDGHFGLVLWRFSCAGMLALVFAYLSRRYFEARFLKLKDYVIADAVLRDQNERQASLALTHSPIKFPAE